MATTHSHSLKIVRNLYFTEIFTITIKHNYLAGNNFGFVNFLLKAILSFDSKLNFNLNLNEILINKFVQMKLVCVCGIDERIFFRSLFRLSFICWKEWHV